jgi:hypothetical protein
MPGHSCSFCPLGSALIASVGKDDLVLGHAAVRGLG